MPAIPPSGDDCAVDRNDHPRRHRTCRSASPKSPTDLQRTPGRHATNPAESGTPPGPRKKPIRVKTPTRCLIARETSPVRSCLDSRAGLPRWGRTVGRPLNKPQTLPAPQALGAKANRAAVIRPTRQPRRSTRLRRRRPSLPALVVPAPYAAASGSRRRTGRPARPAKAVASASMTAAAASRTASVAGVAQSNTHPHGERAGDRRRRMRLRRCGIPRLPPSPARPRSRADGALPQTARHRDRCRGRRCCGTSATA